MGRERRQLGTASTLLDPEAHQLDRDDGAVTLAEDAVRRAVLGPRHERIDAELGTDGRPGVREALAAAANGISADFAVVWQSAGQDGDAAGVLPRGAPSKL